MIVIEKIPQKFLNLKSKGIIKDFNIIVYEERIKKLKLNNDENADHFSNYKEKVIGEYVLIWDENTYSNGEFTITDIDNLETFIHNAQKYKKRYDHVYIPKKSLYPIIRANNKITGDYVDNPEYLLKILDITKELDDTIKLKKSITEIEVIDGYVYAFFSENPQENYAYTRFTINKNFDKEFEWNYSSVESLSIVQIQEIFSYLGDIYNLIKREETINFNKDVIDVVITPTIFEYIINEVLIKNIKGENVLDNQSIFKQEDFLNKKRVLGLLSLSYDPLINLKLGTYPFTDYGTIAKKEYFIKAGRLETPILNQFNYSDFNRNEPTVQIKSLENLKIEGLSKTSFKNLRNIEKDFILIPSIKFINIENQTKCKIICPNALYISTIYSKISNLKEIMFEFDVINYLLERKIELVEFIDNKTGAKLKSINVVTL